MFCYIHIPFCESKCKYCRFSSFVWNNNLEKENYKNFLLKSINQFDLKKEKLSSIYFWWWTPTSFSNLYLWEIIFALKKKFDLKKNIEISLESTISNISSKNLDYWFNKLKISRLSFWIQTLNDESLKEIWRQNKKTILKKLNILKKYLIDKKYDVSINFDFIIWLPYVKKWEILEDLIFILENYFFVKHISLYMLEEYYDYPKNWKNLCLSEEEFLSEYINCKIYLEKSWFKKYEISNFAKSWFTCKHNKAYWNHSEIISFWLSSHSFLDNTRFAYPKNFNDLYLQKIEFSEKLQEKDLFLEKVLFSLRTSWLEKIIYKELNQNKIQYFIQMKLLKITKEKIILTDNWTLLLDYILKEIID